MKSLIPSIWNRVQDWQGDKRIKEYVEAIQDHADQSDPILSRDPIAFISVFATVLFGLVPKEVVQRFEDDIYEVVCELVKIVLGAHGQLSTWSRKRCVEEIDPAFWGLYLQHGFDSPSSATHYLGFATIHSEAYNPSTNRLISSRSLSTFIRLVQENPTSAAFSLLTMYSIRHRTLADYPDSFDNLLQGLSDSERVSHGIGKLTIPSPSPL